MRDTQNTQTRSIRLPMDRAYMHAAECIQTYSADPSAVHVGRARPGYVLHVEWKANRPDEFYEAYDDFRDHLDALGHFGGRHGVAYFATREEAERIATYHGTVGASITEEACTVLTAPADVLDSIEASERKGTSVCLYYP